MYEENTQPMLRGVMKFTKCLFVLMIFQDLCQVYPSLLLFSLLEKRLFFCCKQNFELPPQEASESLVNDSSLKLCFFFCGTGQVLDQKRVQMNPYRIPFKKQPKNKLKQQFKYTPEN